MLLTLVIAVAAQRDLAIRHRAASPAAAARPRRPPVSDGHRAAQREAPLPRFRSRSKTCATIRWSISAATSQDSLGPHAADELPPQPAAARSLRLYRLPHQHQVSLRAVPRLALRRAQERDHRLPGAALAVAPCRRRCSAAGEQTVGKRADAGPSTPCASCRAATIRATSTGKLSATRPADGARVRRRSGAAGDAVSRQPAASRRTKRACKRSTT